MDQNPNLHMLKLLNKPKIPCLVTSLGVNGLDATDGKTQFVYKLNNAKQPMRQIYRAL